MNSRLTFNSYVERWRQHVSAWQQYHYYCLTQGVGNICTPAMMEVTEYAPFSSSSYTYAEQIHGLYREPWHTIMDLDPATIIPVNPLATSPYRPGCWQVWDAAVGVPACAMRVPKPILMRNVPVYRGINAEWTDVIRPQLNNLSMAAPDTRATRPEGAKIVDFSRIEGGWKMMEAAHALAHRRADLKNPRRAYAKNMGLTEGWLRKTLAEMAVAILYGLPIDVSDRDQGVPGEPGFAQYGLEVKSSSWFTDPILRIPWNNREAPRFDSTLAIMTVAIFVEPHPYGYNVGNMDQAPRNNRWCCLPTIAAIAGWETVDYITHLPIGVSSLDYKDPPLCYLAQPADLQPPDMFGAYMAIANEHPSMGPPRVDNKRYWLLEDWLRSQDYEELIMSTPPLPCRQCMAINPRVTGAPVRPKGEAPEGKLNLRRKAHREWDGYRKGMSDIYKIVKHATEACEDIRLGGASKRRAYQAARRKGYKSALGQRRNELLLEKAQLKRNKGRALTKTERAVFNAHNTNT